jgi:ABC-type multidrug transport system fused ATPase/permease subunit
MFSNSEAAYTRSVREDN